MKHWYLLESVACRNSSCVGETIVNTPLLSSEVAIGIATSSEAHEPYLEARPHSQNV